ncbi:nucleotide sugar dehydrogenase [Nocardiopsis quinghaiensis]|uniref:nucleotide sugar dehydrogenase n=1 Tax=Nocardiopsis quinghaiensis TaxID=464995 RepID=UPI001239AE0D|nr:nucleotide sugar dehydrogenase [Nocardiopsis quinghaiensis]
MRFLRDREKFRVSVIGLGHVGSCVALALAHRGVDVVGVDTDTALVEELGRGHCRFQEPDLADLLTRCRGLPTLRFSSNHSAISSTDVVIVVVGTPVDESGTFVDTQLRDACKEMSRHLRRGQLLVFKSTVPPGTTRDLVIPLLESGGLTCGEDFGVAFSPERLSQGAALRELTTLPVVVGGADPHSVEAAEAFWRTALGVETTSCSSLETAEMIKIASNWWIDHNLALANELALVCSRFGVDTLEVVAATNSLPKGEGNVNILLPSVGVGGSCLTKDPWMLWSTAREHGVELSTVTTSRGVNDGMPGHAARMTVGAVESLGRTPSTAKVAVLGLAFKNDTGDLRATPVARMVRDLRDLGVEVALHDPLVEEADAERVFGLPLCPSVEDAVRDADCLAVTAWHKEFSSIDFAELKRYTSSRCAVMDGRAYFSRETIGQLESLGYTYLGIGR